MFLSKLSILLRELLFVTMHYWTVATYSLLLVSLLSFSFAASTQSPHIHTGTLPVPDGRLLSYSVTQSQDILLSQQKPVVIQNITKSGGGGFVIQDVHAPTDICMKLLLDCEEYPSRVPRVQKVTKTASENFSNGTTITYADFSVGISFFRAQYFLKTVYRPEFQTLSWTLDYKFKSDLDDSVGQWQVMEHPQRRGWTRLVFTTSIKLFSWVPSFVVNKMTSSALVESVSWVKREAERRNPLSTHFDKSASVLRSIPDMLGRAAGSPTLEGEAPEYGHCYTHAESLERSLLEFSGECANSAVTAGQCQQADICN